MKTNSAHKNSQAAANVGKYVSSEYSTYLQNSYRERFPGTSSAFPIPKVLIKKVLSDYPNADGIRFTYGLRDELNPNSISIFLIPCYGTEQNTQPLITETGYFDHEARLYSLTEVTQFLSNFVRDIVNRDDRMVYKEATRGGFFGRNSILDLIKDERCQYVKFSFGLKGKVIQAIMEPLDAIFHAYAEVYMDFSRPCPPYCDPNTIDDPCLVTKAVSCFSAEVELDQYRRFRDQVLLNYREGGGLYEMYYFISPLITSVINRQSERKEAFRKIYEEKILPFKQLVDEDQEAEAVQFLASAFAALAEEHQVASAV